MRLKGDVAIRQKLKLPVSFSPYFAEIYRSALRYCKITSPILGFQKWACIVFESTLYPRLQPITRRDKIIPIGVFCAYL
jgi:hypothetical protein